MQSNFMALQVLCAHLVPYPAFHVVSWLDSRFCAAPTSAPLSAGTTAYLPRHLLKGIFAASELWRLRLNLLPPICVQVLMWTRVFISFG